MMAKQIWGKLGVALVPQVERRMTDLEVVSRKCIVRHCYKVFRIHNISYSEHGRFSNIKIH